MRPVPNHQTSGRVPGLFLGILPLICGRVGKRRGPRNLHGIESGCSGFGNMQGIVKAAWRTEGCSGVGNMQGSLAHGGLHWLVSDREIQCPEVAVFVGGPQALSK